MKEKIHEDDRKAAKTPLMIFLARFNDCTLWIHLSQNECQLNVIEVWSWIMGILSGDGLRPFINKELVTSIGKSDIEVVSTQYCKSAWTEGQQCFRL